MILKYCLSITRNRTKIIILLILAIIVSFSHLDYLQNKNKIYAVTNVGFTNDHNISEPSSNKTMIILQNNLQNWDYNNLDHDDQTEAALGTMANPLHPDYIKEVDETLFDPASKVTIPFLKNYQNNCWYSKVIGNVSNFYKDNLMQAVIDQGGKPRWLLKLSDVRDAIIKNNETIQIKCLPSIYFIGVIKCGTTDIFGKLSKHPQIFLGKKKEYAWWIKLRHGMVKIYGERKNVSLSDYVESFDHAARSISQTCPGVKSEEDFHPCLTIDGTVRMLFYSHFSTKYINGRPSLPEPGKMEPGIMYKLQPNAKLLLIIREPVSRCYSDYFYFFWFSNKTKDAAKFHADAVISLKVLQDCIALYGDKYCAYDHILQSKMNVRLTASMYYVHLKHWLSVWPRDQLYVVAAEFFYKNNTTVFNEITNFLNIDPFPPEQTSTFQERPPANNNPPSEGGKIWPETKKLLQDFFQPYNDMLAGLLRDDIYRWK